ncbi:MAG: TMEM175 family protein [Streptococcaceae bacterium]|nr:TMEM175 family protein [Streptococcaceae bacterium]
MVDKERLTSFMDNTIAVIMTICLLQFQIPSSGQALDFIQNNLAYMIAYGLSFIYVSKAWYNQQWLMKQAQVVNRKIYVSCMQWLFSFSLLPVLATWMGRTMNLFDNFGLNSQKIPAMLFICMLYLWGFTYVNMRKAIINENPSIDVQPDGQMEAFRILGRPLWEIGTLVWVVGLLTSLSITFIYPPAALIIIATETRWDVVKKRNS